MYIVVGLGNPGEEYKETRHNTGRIILESVAKTFDFPQWEADKKTRALISDGKIGKEKVRFILPETFMNKSGQSVAPLVTNPKKAEQLVVVYDDLDLPVGRFKISFNRSSGGHKGIESIIRAVKTEAFVRIRVGISPKTPTGKIKKPSGDAIVGDFILGKFKDAEMAEIKKVAKRVGEVIAMIVSLGASAKGTRIAREKAMGEFNGI
ncbi:aminoacyl-tRNA hydrolase [Candidatus Parcubacteria bacterium]|nr:aminoacyl-tRNA hydrolase [Candidatus Parcubacteria bacterium]